MSSESVPIGLGASASNDAALDIPATDPGDSFEEMFWNLLRRRYPPTDMTYMPATMGGDYGIEGFTSDGIAYQCYADRDSLTLRNRTDKQKKKLYDDTCKLKQYANKLEGVLDGLKIEHYFLVVPQYHAAELVAHAATRAKAVREYQLSFIGESFSIKIKTLRDYPAELTAALRDDDAKAVVPDTEIQIERIDSFCVERPELMEVLDAKLAVVAASRNNADVASLRAQFIRAFLKKEHAMAVLRDWPQTWEAVERRRQLRQEALELESELSPDSPNRRVLDLVQDYKNDLAVNVGGIGGPDAQRIAMGQVGEWLMRCPLHFGAAS